MSTEPKTVPDWLTAKAKALKIGREPAKRTRRKNRQMPNRKRALGAKFKPYHAGLSADWHIFLRRAYVVWRATNTPSTPSDTPVTSTDLLTYVKSLTPDGLQSLIADFTSKHPIDMKKVEGYTVNSDIKDIKQAFSKAVMYQLALGDNNLCTFAVNFHDDFMEKKAGYSSVTITEAVNKEIRNALDEVWRDRVMAEGVPYPSYFHVLDYGDQPPLDRGPGGFHVHGIITADENQLPLIKEALEMASNGYKNSHSRFQKKNKAVHFGEPCSDFSNRGGHSTNCLSDYPGAQRAAVEDYNFKQCGYLAQKEKPVRAAEKALKVNVGRIWSYSTGLSVEAKASLKLTKLLLDNLS